MAPGPSLLQSPRRLAVLHPTPRKTESAMLVPRFSQTRARLAAVFPSRARARTFGLVLLAALAGGCGGQTSTDTGNPPISFGQQLRLTATDTGVRVSGEPGTVAGGARVDVIN